MSTATTEREQLATTGLVPTPRVSAERVVAAPRDHRAAGGWIRGHRLLLAILSSALVVRLWDIAGNLPVVHHPDEVNNLRVILGIAAGDPNPHFFNYPSLFLYLQAAVSLDGPVLGWLIPGDRAVLPVPQVMGSSYAPSVYTVLLHRTVSVALGVALVAVVWAIARRTVGGRIAPAVAAGLVAVSPNLVEHSRYVTPDMLATFLIALGVLAALHVLESGSLRSYLLAGLVVGLAMSAKYNAALVAAAVVAACLIRFWRTRDRSGPEHLVLSGNAALAGFLLTTPYALLDNAAFMAGVQFERAHYATGHIGMEGGTPAFYARVLLLEEAAITVPALAGVVLMIAGSRMHRQFAAVLLAFPLVYGAFVFAMPVRNDRTIMVVLPLLAVLAGYAVGVAVTALRRSAAARGQALTWRTVADRQRPLRAVGAGLLAAAVLTGLWSGLTANSVHDARAEAAEWIAQNVPADSDIVLESYSPWVDPEVYDVTGRMALIRDDLPWGTDYVIASQLMSGRYADDPERFPEQAAAYERLFGSLELVREFGEGENAIRVYAAD